MTEYGPELNLFVLKSSMSWHCFEIKHVMTSRLFPGYSGLGLILRMVQAMQSE